MNEKSGRLVSGREAESLAGRTFGTACDVCVVVRFRWRNLGIAFSASVVLGEAVDGNDAPRVHECVVVSLGYSPVFMDEVVGVGVVVLDVSNVGNFFDGHILLVSQ